jgi:hypothetical protein
VDSLLGTGMPQTIAEPEWSGDWQEGNRAGGDGLQAHRLSDCSPRYIGKMTKLKPGSIVCHMPNPVAADVAGETVLMSLERSRCYGLGEIGSDIWSKLASPVRVEDLIEDLSARYQAPPGVIERDVLHLLTQLAAEGLIKIS